MSYFLGDLGTDGDFRNPAGASVTFRQSPFRTGTTGTSSAAPATGTLPLPGQTGTTTSEAGNTAGGSAIAGKYIGTAVGQRYSPTTFGKQAGSLGKGGDSSFPGKTATGGKPVRGAQIQPVVPATPASVAPAETAPEAPPVAPETVPQPTTPEAPAGEGAGASFFSQYKWWIVGGGAVIIAGIGAYFMLRKKAPATGDFAALPPDLWIFDWIGGGGNEVRAYTRSEALRKARQLGSPRPLPKLLGGGHTKGLVVKESTLRQPSEEEYKRWAHNIDSMTW